jgi:hypothetical protein
LGIRAEIWDKSFAEVLIIVTLRLASRASPATGWPSAHTRTSIARLSVHIITGDSTPFLVVKRSLFVVIAPGWCGTIAAPIIVRFVIARGDSAHGRFLLAAHPALEKL